MHVGSMCASAPALKAFYTHYFKQNRPLRSTAQRTNTTGYSTSSSLWSRISFWKKLSSRGNSGYLSESHTSKHGAIVQLNAHDDTYEKQRTPTPEHGETIIARSDGYGDKNDIEMGRILSTTNISVGGRDVQALPAMRAPEPARAWKIWDRRNG